ncbi:MAG: FISUMP domain-containing protein [candidate division KSB1 bacterium]|nr:FISUMP domain-containing protein [candidate division KSB1 bacterium]
MKRIVLLVLVFLIAGCGRQPDPTFDNSVVMRKAEPLTDPRDGRTYQTVRIGTQVWMAENLNYGVAVEDCEQSDNSIAEKTFYNNDPDAEQAYGALYTWNEAMQWTQQQGAQGVCPPGWHVPTREDWAYAAQRARCRFIRTKTQSIKNRFHFLGRKQCDRIHSHLVRGGLS